MIEAWTDQVINIDCIEGMGRLQDASVDLIVADPPYNLDKNFGEWDERQHRDDWLDWTKRWLTQCSRVLRAGGNIFVYGIHRNICWVQCHLYDLGLTYRRQIIWHYENGFAGYTRSLAAHYEPLLWFSKGEGYTFHPIREPYKSLERLKHPITKNGRVWTPNPEGRLAGDVWRFPVLAGRRFRNERVDHPTQKPISISRRILEHFSDPGDLVLVPFAGSGSECVAAKLALRNFIGFELNAEYVALANERLDAVGSADPAEPKGGKAIQGRLSLR